MVFPNGVLTSFSRGRFSGDVFSITGGYIWKKHRHLLGMLPSYLEWSQPHTTTSTPFKGAIRNRSWWHMITWPDKRLATGGFKDLLFSPRTLGKWSNLTIIFFNWVETTNQKKLAFSDPKFFTSFFAHGLWVWSEGTVGLFCFANTCLLRNVVDGFMYCFQQLANRLRTKNMQK